MPFTFLAKLRDSVCQLLCTSLKAFASDVVLHRTLYALGTVTEVGRDHHLRESGIGHALAAAGALAAALTAKTSVDWQLVIGELPGMSASMLEDLHVQCSQVLKVYFHSVEVSFALQKHIVTLCADGHEFEIPLSLLLLLPKLLSMALITSWMIGDGANVTNCDTPTKLTEYWLRHSTLTAIATDEPAPLINWDTASCTAAAVYCGVLANMRVVKNVWAADVQAHVASTLNLIVDEADKSMKCFNIHHTVR